jgi:hypothetical protein
MGVVGFMPPARFFSKGVAPPDVTMEEIFASSWLR